MTGAWVDTFESCLALSGVVITSSYFAAALLVGFLLVMNLFVAILCEAFAQDEDEDDEYYDIFSDDDDDMSRGAENSLVVGATAGGAGGAGGASGAGEKSDQTESSEPGGGAKRWRKMSHSNRFAVGSNEYSLGCLSRNLAFRRQCIVIMTDPLFDQVVLFFILASSLCLALDSPRLDPDSNLAIALDYLNYLFAAIFLVECIIKVCAVRSRGSLF
eukprot:867689-Pleurochrysis_carterae.AAC.1